MFNKYLSKNRKENAQQNIFSTVFQFISVTMKFTLEIFDFSI